MTDTHQQTLPEGGKARRVYLLLRDDILSGAVSAGAMLAGEQRLAETHAVSRVTIRRALDALEADGLIDRKAGSGTRVLGPAQGQTMAADMATLIPQIVKMGEHSAGCYRFLTVLHRTMWQMPWGWRPMTECSARFGSVLPPIRRFRI